MEAHVLAIISCSEPLNRFPPSAISFGPRAGVGLPALAAARQAMPSMAPRNLEVAKKAG
jgi:hypothetical protein